MTIGFGFKGGEVVPSFFVGACFGCVLGGLLGLPAGFGAALGLAAGVLAGPQAESRSASDIPPARTGGGILRGGELPHCVGLFEH